MENLHPKDEEWVEHLEVTWHTNLEPLHIVIRTPWFRRSSSVHAVANGGFTEFDTMPVVGGGHRDVIMVYANGAN